MASLTYISPAEIDDRFTEVIDVRSPGEFAEDHLPGAINLPVLDDTERAEVGTLYKQVNPFVARKVGAAKIARNVATYLEGVLAEKPPNYRPLLYCWRGGQRSASMATILSEVGWPVNVVKGGYDGYRRFVREGLEETTREGHLDFRLIGGLTGSGKTVLLDALTEAGHQVLDLEGLANHRGSLLGRSYPVPVQPSQKAFESAVFDVLRNCESGRPVFVESESNKVGDLHVPPGLWGRMRTCPAIEIKVPQAARAKYLLEAYPHFVEDPKHLVATLDPLRKNLGNALIDQWNALIAAGAWQEFVESSLENHYDPAYTRSRERLFQPPAKMFEMVGVTPEEVANVVRDLSGENA